MRIKAAQCISSVKAICVPSLLLAAACRAMQVTNWTRDHRQADPGSHTNTPPQPLLVANCHIRQPYTTHACRAMQGDDWSEVIDRQTQEATQSIPPEVRDQLPPDAPESPFSPDDVTSPRGDPQGELPLIPEGPPVGSTPGADDFIGGSPRGPPESHPVTPFANARVHRTVGELSFWAVGSSCVHLSVHLCISAHAPEAVVRCPLIMGHSRSCSKGQLPAKSARSRMPGQILELG